MIAHIQRVSANLHRAIVERHHRPSYLALVKTVSHLMQHTIKVHRLVAHSRPSVKLSHQPAVSRHAQVQVVCTLPMRKHPHRPAIRVRIQHHVEGETPVGQVAVRQRQTITVLAR